MAKVVFINAVITGSIGGTTYQKNGSGYIARAKGIGKKTRTIRQNKANQIPNRWIQDWRNLTSSQRLSWTNYGIAHQHTNLFGVLRTISGFNWFVSINENLYSINQSSLSSAPTYITPQPTPNYSIIISSTVFKIVFTESLNLIDNGIQIFFSYWHSPSNKYKRNYFIIAQKYESGITNTIDLKNIWESRYGINWATVFPSVNQNIWIISQYISKVSGITGVARFKTLSPTSGTGIGEMIIEDTFFVN